jgi:hypothetical protein
LGEGGYQIVNIVNITTVSINLDLMPDFVSSILDYILLLLILYSNKTSLPLLFILETLKKQVIMS